MRNRLFGLCVSVPIALLAWTGTAHANSISLIWQATGTSSIFANVSSTVTADVVVAVSGAGNPVRLGWSIAFDAEVDELFGAGSCGSDFCSFTPVGGGTNWEDLTILGQGPDGDAPNPGPSYETSWSVAGPPGEELSLGTATVGTITFHVKALAAGGIDIVPAFLNSPAGDGCIIQGPGHCDGTVTFFAAQIFTPVPEPGTLALLGAGLLGLRLAARTRRRG